MYIHSTNILNSDKEEEEKTLESIVSLNAIELGILLSFSDCIECRLAFTDQLTWQKYTNTYHSVLNNTIEDTLEVFSWLKRNNVPDSIASGVLPCAVSREYLITGSQIDLGNFNTLLQKISDKLSFLQS